MSVLIIDDTERSHMSRNYRFEGHDLDVVMIKGVYHLSATILENLGVEGEGTAQLLGREVHLDFPVISLHHHLLEVALRVRISHIPL